MLLNLTQFLFLHKISDVWIKVGWLFATVIATTLTYTRSLSDWLILIAQGGTWAIKISINQAPLGVCRVKIAASRNFFNSKRTSPTNS